MADLKLRKGVEGDFCDLADLYDRVIEANSGTAFDVHWDRSFHPSDAEISSAIETGTLYVGERDGRIVAAAIVNDDFACGYERTEWKVKAAEGEAVCVHLVVTDPDLQGQGLGLWFMQSVIEDVRACGFKVMRLDAYKHNEPACRLYERVGFEYRGVGHLEYDAMDVSFWELSMYELAL